mgnify:CR=1 FL=1
MKVFCFSILSEENEEKQTFQFSSNDEQKIFLKMKKQQKGS